MSGLEHQPTPSRPPSREEVDIRVGEAQRKLGELKRAQEELERERAGLEEVRRRQIEFQTSREEVRQNLTRGFGLLEEAEFNARREADQMAKTLADLRSAFEKVQAINEEHWTKDNFSVELTRALTTIENAQMEWNAARVKFPLLSNPQNLKTSDIPPGTAPADFLTHLDWRKLCHLGLALTWPLVLVALLALAAFLWALKR